VIILVIGKCSERIPPCSSLLIETSSDVIFKTMMDCICVWYVQVPSQACREIDKGREKRKIRKLERKDTKGRVGGEIE
jgi:hypothetical protein